MPNQLRLLLCIGVLTAPAAIAFAQPAASKRPYEFDWAQRNQDEFPPLVDFEDNTPWKAEGTDGVVRLERSQEHQLWGQSVGKLTYRATGDKLNTRLLLPKPVKIEGPFNAMTLWVYGNKFDFEKSNNTSTISLGVLFEDADGQEVEVPFRSLDWNEWFLLYRRFDSGLANRLAKGASFKGFTVTGGTNPADRAIFLDNFAVFTEPTTPLQFEPRPRRGLSLLPGGTAGTNTGPGKLDFPNRPQTILPDTLDTKAVTIGTIQDGAFVWTYTGSDGQLVYRLDPRTGTFGDITARWQPYGGFESGIIHPCVGGGAYLRVNGKAVAPEQAELLGSDMKDGVATFRWKLRAGTVTQEVTYRFRLWGKSLVMDVAALGGNIAEVRYGRASGLENPRLQTNPYYLYARGRRPAVVVAGEPETPLFLTGNTDWYLSNATALWADNDDSPEGVQYNGGCRYIPRTDGTVNDCYERLFLTISPRYEEVLPNIPNPKSPYMKVTGTRLWRTFGSGDRKSDIGYWEDLHRYGITEVVVNNHETMWRDGQESFTFRTKTAPGKGGDAGEVEFSRAMQDRLGYVYGPYNNYTDIAPVNEFWKLDMAIRLPDGQFQESWYRCYAPKPARAVEYAAKIPPILQDKFHFSTAYCDVHTAVGPWDRVDYDPRVPGAGTFAGTFYAFGEILEMQKRTWKGPVYSEGGFHAFYSGLTDGNYAQDPSADLPNQPWLVDFDLRKMHPLSTNFGMGNPGMFDPSPQPPDVKGQDARLDRFLAATVAFGHTGFLEYGTKGSLRSYYMLQQLQSRYTQSNVAEIRYADAGGRLWETSSAVARGIFRRSQIVTRYQDGTVTAVNGSRTERMAVNAYGHRFDLAPNGYAGWTADGRVRVLSNDIDGRRADYSDSPEYIYVDGRGQFARFDNAGGTEIGVCRILGRNKYEIIPFEGAECGFAIQGISAIALDKAGKTIGPAQLRSARGLTYVLPVAGAFSYEVTGQDKAPASALRCARDQVVPGERVTVEGNQPYEVEIPATAKPGERIWRQFENQWIDFTVVASTVTAITLEGDAVRLTSQSNLATAADFRVWVTDDGNNVLSAPLPELKLHLEPGRTETLNIPLGAATKLGDGTINLSLQSGGITQRFKLAVTAKAELAPLVELPARGRSGVVIDGQGEVMDLGTTGASVEQRPVTAGGVSKAATFMHPPWQNVTGATFLRYDNVALPAQPAILRAFVGKADGSFAGNGLIYKVVVVDQTHSATVVGQAKVTEHEWLPIEADLSRWAGQRVSLKLITDSNGDTSGDWGAWAEVRVTSRETRISRSLRGVSEE